jgi:hypothetical protein
VLNDPFNEFFIQRLHHGTSVTSVISDDTKTVPESSLVASSSSVGTLIPTSIDNDWNIEYGVHTSMLPVGYIPVSLANKVIHSLLPFPWNYHLITAY